MGTTSRSTFIRGGLGLALAAAIGVPAPARAADPPTCESLVATIVGTEGPDVLVGTPAFDVIVGLGGDDRISDVGGDRVCGGEGDDTILSPAGLRARGGPGNDRIEISGAASPASALLYGDEGDDVLIAGDRPSSLYGGDGDDILTGGQADDALEPGPGRDSVDGGDRSDTIYADRSLGPVRIDLRRGLSTGQGRDTITGVEGASGTPGADRLIGDDGPNSLGGQGGQLDVIQGRGGDDSIATGGGTVQGGRGDDRIFLECCFGTAKNDQFDGGGGYDWLFLDPYGYRLGPVRLDLGAGTLTGSTVGTDVASRFEAAEATAYGDTLLGNAADNVFSGRSGDDRFWGRGGNDTIDAGNDDDTLLGGAGDDILDGGHDADTIDGGAGTDSCSHGETLTGCET